MPVRAPRVSTNRDRFGPCLAPDALDDPTLPVKRAEDFVANNSLNERHFGLYLLGAALYRAGQYEQAAEELKNPSPPIRQPTRRLDSMSLLSDYS